MFLWIGRIELNVAEKDEWWERKGAIRCFRGNNLGREEDVTNLRAHGHRGNATNLQLCDHITSVLRGTFPLCYRLLSRKISL